MVIVPLALISYGLAGLFSGSYLMSLVFIPGAVEALILVFLGVGFSPLAVLGMASLGSVLGGSTNYYLGYFSHDLVNKFGIKEKHFKIAEALIKKYGIYGILVSSFIPGFPFDFVAVIVGFLRMNFKNFFLWMTLGKILKYIIIVFGIHTFLGIFNIFGGL